MAIIDTVIENARWQDVLPTVEDLVVAVGHDLFDVQGLAGRDDIEVSVALVDDVRMQELNQEYRDKDQPTNVLSFDQLGLSAGDPVPEGPQLLGDVIIALETVQNEAQSQTKSVEDHFSHLLIHGLLHLLGYDHIDDHDAQVMEALEADILARRGINNPYDLKEPL